MKIDTEYLESRREELWDKPRAELITLILNLELELDRNGLFDAFYDD